MIYATIQEAFVILLVKASKEDVSSFSHTSFIACQNNQDYFRTYIYIGKCHHTGSLKICHSMQTNVYSFEPFKFYTHSEVGHRGNIVTHIIYTSCKPSSADKRLIGCILIYNLYTASWSLWRVYMLGGLQLHLPLFLYQCC